MKERIAEGLPYPVEDRDTEDSQIVANVEADHLIDRRCHHSRCRRANTTST